MADSQPVISSNGPLTRSMSATRSGAHLLQGSLCEASGFAKGLCSTAA